VEGISLGSAFLRLYGDRTALDRELKLLGRYTEQLERKGIKVSIDADTGKARRDVDALKASLNSTNEAFKLLGQGLRGDKSAWAGIGDTLQGVAGKAAASGGAIGKMGGALGGAASLAGKAIPVLGQLGLAAQGLKFIFDGLSSAINGVLAPLKALSYEAGKFNAKVAEAGIFTSSAFAVMGPDGQAVEGTANQMRALRGTIAKEFREIKREASDIAGATASDIFEGFNVILQYSAALGEAGEDLENIRKLSTRTAAAMNVMGIPAYQLRSELSSLLTGNINAANDKLARDLGFDRQSIQRLQEEGKLYDELMTRLNKLYDGQKVLADSLSNVASNFESVFQTINAQGGIALERGMGKALAAVLDPLARLENSFIAFVRGSNEFLEPLLKMLGEVAGWFVSAGAMIASTLGAVMDVLALLGSILGSVLLPGLKGIGKLLQVVAKFFEFIGALVSSLLRPITTFFRLFGDSEANQIEELFDKLLDGFDELIGYANKAATVVAKPFIETAKAIEWLRGKQAGLSDEEIAQRQADAVAGFEAAVGASSTPSLRSLNLSSPTKALIQSIADRYGATEQDEQLQQQREMSQLVTDRINNEVKGLEQSLRLMQAQKTVQEALSQLAEARRNIGMSRAGFSVQLAASPEARLQAEERRSELARQQEQERISERRALLGTERQMLQMQLQIQLRQQRLQQEQLKIQKAEIEIQRFKAEQAAREVASKLVGLNPNSTEYKALRAQWTLIGKELQLRDQQLQVMRRTQELAVEQEGVIRQTTELEGQRLDIQGQALGVQVEMANLTREQQQTMARLQAEEQQITNALEQQLNAKRELQRENEESLRTLQNEMRAAEELQKLEQSRMELTKARADAQVEAAERELRVAQAQANASAPGSSTREVISAQIEALAAGQRGMVSEADATRRLYQAKQKQLEAEQTIRREQQRFQQERERSELRIYEMQLRAQLLSAQQTALQIKAQESQLRLQQERDRLSGAPAAPVLPPPPGSQSGVGSGAAPATQSNGASRLLDIASSKLGLFAGQTERCADAIRELFQVAGVAIGTTKKAWDGLGSGPRLASSFFGDDIGQRIDRREDLRPGDLVGFERTYGNWGPGVQTHAGLYAGNGMMYDHSSRQGLVKRPVDTFQGKFMYGVRPYALGGATQGSVATSNQPAGAQPAATSSTENTASRLANEAAANTNLLQDLKDLLDRLTKELIPNLDQIQQNQGDALAQADAAQRQAMEVERIRAQITAELLATPRGRLAADLSDGIAAGITGPIRAAFSQLFRGEMNFAQMSEELSIQMAERLTGALLNAALAPIEQQLKGTLFQAISGVDLEEEALKAQQEAAQGLKEAGDNLKEAANSLKSVGTASPAAQAPSSIQLGDIQRLGASTWQKGFDPSTDLDTKAIEDKAREAGKKLEKLGEDAEEASDSTKDFMAAAGKAMVALGGLAMAAGGVQQMSKGGTYNTLMGLASIFGGIASVTGAFARARGGPVTANTPYLVGEEGPELFVPQQDGEVNSTSRTQALLAAQGALGGNQMAGSTDNSQDGMGGSSATGTALQMSNAAVRAQQQLLRERSSERTFQEVVNRPSGPLDINFQSEVINNVEYVTADQFQRGMSDAANRGRPRGRRRRRLPDHGLEGPRRRGAPSPRARLPMAGDGQGPPVGRTTGALASRHRAR
jgi:hypothetical protein